MAKLAVIGAGSWGTAISALLARNGHEVALWVRNPQTAAAINLDHRNPRYLSESELPRTITASSDLAAVVKDAEAIAVVTPSSAMRSTAEALAACTGPDVPIIICTKGVEEETGLVPCALFADVLGHAERLAALSGPNHAEEVIAGIPAGTVVASASEACAKRFQQLFANERFRVYTSDDVVGVELCAAVKNVVAIACGVSYGLGYGDNTAAMLIPRGQAEMARLVRACGGREITCMGLAGPGDLIATCMSRHSRNRRFGEMLAAGKTLGDFTDQTHMVAEGAYACKSIAALAVRHGVDAPLTEAVRAVVWEGADPAAMGRLLLDRTVKPEFY